MIPVGYYPQERERVMTKGDLVSRIMARSRQINDAKKIIDAIRLIPDISDESRLWTINALEQRIDIAEAAIKGNIKSLPDAPK